MSIFKKRETPIQNIAYMSIMAAINVIFVLLSNILPLLLFLLIFLLPLTSAIVTLYCKKRYYPIYFITTLALCILVSFGFTIFDTLIYVFPSLITGFIFGVSFEKNVPGIMIIVGNTIIQFLLSTLTFYVLGYIITNLNMMNVLINAFGLKDFPYKDTFTLIFLYVISMIQITLTYMFIKLQIKRFTIEFNLEISNKVTLFIGTFIIYSLIILSYFIFPKWTMVFVIMPLPIYIYELISIVVSKSKMGISLLALTHLGFIFIMALLVSKVNQPNQLMLLIVLYGSNTIIDILNNYCFAKRIK